MKSANNTNRYLEMGMASLLPGMQYTVERMQRMLDEFRAELAALQAGHHGARGSVRDAIIEGKRKSGWPADPEERKAEGARRWAARERNEQARAGKKAKGHPRDPNHPGHAAYVAALRKGQKKYWSGLTDEQRAKRVNTMLPRGEGKARNAA